MLVAAGLRGRRLDGACKDTVIVRPTEAVVAAFDADNPGQWASALPQHPPRRVRHDRRLLHRVTVQA